MALERRLRESLEVESRVTNVYNDNDFQQELASAGGKLVLLEVRKRTSEVVGFSNRRSLIRLMHHQQASTDTKRKAKPRCYVRADVLHLVAMLGRADPVRVRLRHRL